MSENLYVEETWETEEKDGKRYLVGESGIYETGYSELGKLFKSCQKEYGRCTGQIYIDKEDQGGIPVGWVFEKKKKFTDTKEPYKQITWVHVYTKKREIRKEITNYNLDVETKETVKTKNTYHMEEG